MGPTLQTFRRGNTTATVDLQGGYLRSFCYKGRQLLYRAHIKPDESNRSSHLCVPFGAVSTDPKKKDNEKYKVDGKVIKGVPQHGFPRKNLWKLSSRRATPEFTEIEMELKNAPGARKKKINKIYPFDFSLRANYRLYDEVLRCTISFTNLSRTKRAVYDIGAHLYFPWKFGMRVKGLEDLWYRDETNWDKRTMKQFWGDDFRQFDDRDWHFRAEERRKFTMIYPDGKRMTLLLNHSGNDLPVNTVVVWTKPSEGEFICLEPVVIGRNSFNNGTAVTVGRQQTVSFSFWIMPGLLRDTLLGSPA